jgi:hypothetical protein
MDEDLDETYVMKAANDIKDFVAHCGLGVSFGSDGSYDAERIEHVAVARAEEGDDANAENMKQKATTRWPKAGGRTSRKNQWICSNRARGSSSWSSLKTSRRLSRQLVCLVLWPYISSSSLLIITERKTSPLFSYTLLILYTKTDTLRYSMSR